MEKTLKTSEELKQELYNAREREEMAMNINEYERINLLLSETGKLSKKEIKRIAIELCFRRVR